MIELHCCDCMDYMRDQPEKAFDLAIVDPEYGINVGGNKAFGSVGGNKAFGSGGGNNIVESTVYKTFDDSKPPEKEYFDELRRVSRNQIVWGANHFIDRMPIASPCWIVWDKQNTGNFADCELAWTSFGTAVRKFTFMWNGLLQADMKNKEKRIHPTQKPMRLYQWLLTNYAKPGQRILDTHLGSGSSAIAAHYFGVDFVGCEKDKYYFQAAKARLDAETRQIAMF